MNWWHWFGIRNNSVNMQLGIEMNVLGVCLWVGVSTERSWRQAPPKQCAYVMPIA